MIFQLFLRWICIQYFSDILTTYLIFNHTIKYLVIIWLIKSEFCILMNLNSEWNADILINNIRQNFRILLKNSFSDTVCCAQYNK